MSKNSEGNMSKMNIPKMNIDTFLFICGISYSDEQITKLQNLVDNFIEKIVETKREYQNYNDFLAEDDHNTKNEEMSSLNPNEEKNKDENNSKNHNYKDFLNIETKQEYSEKDDWKIEEKFHPDSSFDFPVTIFEERSKDGKIKEHKRKPNLDWFNQYDWLHYNISKDSMFCYICMQFRKMSGYKIETAFVTNGVRNWKNALSKFAKHEGSNYHCEAVKTFFDARPNKNIDTRFVNEILEETKIDLIQQDIKEENGEIEFKEPFNTEENISKEVFNLQCDICTQMFKTSKLLKRHKSSVHENKKHVCQHCSRGFRELSTLNQHTKTLHFKMKEEKGTEIRKFMCKLNDCTLSFETKSEYDQHVYIVHEKAKIGNETKLKCITCNKPFKTIGDAMWKHVKICEMVKQCNICKKTFNTSNHLKRHQEHVHEVKKHMCQHCGKSFSVGGHARNHEKAVHLKIKNISCDKCPFTCFSLAKLQDHIACVHSDERPYFCDQCNKTFKLRTHLLGHKKGVHEGIKKISCPKCPMKFSKTSHLIRHDQRVHEQNRETCPYCGKLYAQLKEHISRIHDKQ